MYVRVCVWMYIHEQVAYCAKGGDRERCGCWHNENVSPKERVESQRHYEAPPACNQGGRTNILPTCLFLSLAPSLSHSLTHHPLRPHSHSRILPFALDHTYTLTHPPLSYSYLTLSFPLILSHPSQTFVADIYESEVEQWILNNAGGAMFPKLKKKIALRATELGVEPREKFLSKPYDGPPLWLKYEAAEGVI